MIITKLNSVILVRSWKNLENKISEKRIRLLNAWEELQTILGLIDKETKWLNRLNIAVDEQNKQDYIEHKNLCSLISYFEVSTRTLKILKLQFNN